MKYNVANRQYGMHKIRRPSLLDVCISDTNHIMCHVLLTRRRAIHLSGNGNPLHNTATKQVRQIDCVRAYCNQAGEAEGL